MSRVLNFSFCVDTWLCGTLHCGDDLMENAIISNNDMDLNINDSDTSNETLKELYSSKQFEEYTEMCKAVLKKNLSIFKPCFTWLIYILH